VIAWFSKFVFSNSTCTTYTEVRAELAEFLKLLKASLGKKPPTCCLDTGDDAAGGVGGTKVGAVQVQSNRPP
jgi:hypothetical protein